ARKSMNEPTACSILALIQNGTACGFFFLYLKAINSSAKRNEPSASSSLTVLSSIATPPLVVSCFNFILICSISKYCRLVQGLVQGTVPCTNPMQSQFPHM